MDKDFVIEEYKNKWEYIRHLEDQRHKFVQWYVLIVGGLLTFFLKDIAQDITSFSMLLHNEAYHVVLFFLLVYSIFADIYLLVQKRNYKTYNDRILQLEKNFCDFKLERPPTRVLTTFRVYYTLVTLIGAGIAFLFIYAVSNSILKGYVIAVDYMIAA